MTALPQSRPLKIRRALLSVSDKTGLIPLAQALIRSGAELVASGGTAKVLEESGLAVTPIEKVTGNPEAFGGRMKTLSFQVCSGLLYRRENSQDLKDAEKLGIPAIDCAVINFYPFEKTVDEFKAAGRSLDQPANRAALIEQVDIRGPTMVRAAAKNAPDVLVLTRPEQYAGVITELSDVGGIRPETAMACAAEAWDRIHEYDRAIHEELGAESGTPAAGTLKLRYGENPHQSGDLQVSVDSPIRWTDALTPNELSYNNILDLAGAYQLAAELKKLHPDSVSVVIVKHNNPCGVASVPRAIEEAQKVALIRAWDGDPVSAFGGVLVFTDPVEGTVAQWLAERFVEVVAAPGIKKSAALATILAKRKKLKAVEIDRFEIASEKLVVSVPGGILRQTPDAGVDEDFKCVTRVSWPQGHEEVARFGVAVCRALKSNTIAMVREIPGVSGGFQLVGAGQGQPNRVEALKLLAIPRAQATLRGEGGRIGDCLMISDAFFPFRDTVDTAHAAGVKFIVQPGGSIKDQESIAACDEHGISMVFTGKRHFRH